MSGSEKFNQVAENKLGVSFRLVEITKKSDRDVIAQLVNKDVVHAFGTDTVDSLLAYRLGGAGWNRTCFAMIDDDSKLHSAIYVHKDYAVIDSERDLNGDAKDIVLKTARRFEETPQSLIFYSICALSRENASALLIRNVHGHVTTTYPGAVMSTLSPLRQPKEGAGIDDFIAAKTDMNFESCTDSEKRTVALHFLLDKENREDVRNFHLKNGASIGDIKLDADTRGKHRIMVNYLYASDEGTLLQNRLKYLANDTYAVTSRNLLAETGIGERSSPASQPTIPAPF